MHLFLWRKSVANGDEGSALNHIRKLSSLFPIDPNLVKQMGGYLIDLSLYKEASHLYSQALDFCEIDIGIACDQIYVSVKLNNIDAAIALCGEVLLANDFSEAAQNSILKTLNRLDDGGAINSLVSEISTQFGESSKSFIARLYCQFGKYEDALAIFNSCLGKLEPSSADAHAIAVCFFHTGAFDQAAETYRNILKWDPLDLGASLGLANAEYARDKDAGLKILEDLIAREDKFAPALYQLGAWYQLASRYSEAEILFRKLIDLNPDSAHVHVQLGGILDAMGRTEEAIHELELAFCIDRSLVHARIRAATIYSKTSLAEAIKLINDTLQLEGLEKNASLLSEKSRLLHEAHDLAGAIRSLSLALEYDPKSVAKQNTYAVLLRESGEIEAALSAIERAELLSQKQQDHIFFNKGTILGDSGRYDEAIAYFNKAIQLNPSDLSIRWYPAIYALAYHNYREGWANYEFRFHKAEAVRREFNLARWELGRRGTVLVYREQGLGDEIMFASCIPELLNCVDSVVIECHPKLEALYRRSFPEAEVIGNLDMNDTSWLDGKLGIDTELPCGSLPLHFRNSLSEFGEGSPYLLHDISKAIQWQNRLAPFSGKRLVALSWRGGSYQTRSGLRSVSVEKLGSLLSLPNTEFFSLQYGEVQEDLATIEQTFGVKIHHFQDMVDDYDETAAFLANMDVVVSVQTSLVHLCGALGVPVLCMLPKVPEWRYGYTGDSMPWYGSVRLFRQQSSGDWSDVLENVCAAIEQDFI